MTLRFKSSQTLQNTFFLSALLSVYEYSFLDNTPFRMFPEFINKLSPIIKENAMILKFLENLAVEDHPAPSYQLQLNQSLFNNEFSFENCGRTNFYYFLKFSTTKILKFGFPTFTQSIYQTIYCCLAWPNYQNGPNIRIHVPKCGLLTNCIQNWGQIAKKNPQSTANQCFIGNLYKMQITFDLSFFILSTNFPF